MRVVEALTAVEYEVPAVASSFDTKNSNQFTMAEACDIGHSNAAIASQATGAAYSSRSVTSEGKPLTKRVRTSSSTEDGAAASAAAAAEADAA